MSSDRDTLAAALHAQACGCRNAVGRDDFKEEDDPQYHEMADAILAPGGWLVEHDRAVAAKALTDAADELERAAVHAAKAVRFTVQNVQGPLTAADWLRARAGSTEENQG